MGDDGLLVVLSSVTLSDPVLLFKVLWFCIILLCVSSCNLLPVTVGCLAFRGRFLDLARAFPAEDGGDGRILWGLLGDIGDSGFKICL